MRTPCMRRYVADGTADLVSYGVPFIANANLPALIAAGKRTADLNMGEAGGVATCAQRAPASRVCSE